MRRLMISGVIGLVFVLPAIVLVGISDSGFARLLAFVFLQYPGMLIGYVVGDVVSIYTLGIVTWILWSVVTFAVLWCLETLFIGRRSADRLSRHV